MQSVICGATGMFGQHLDGGKVKEALGCSPSKDLDETVRRTLH
jgi:hypothetical protein